MAPALPVACLLVPSLALSVALAERTQLATRPVVLVDAERVRVLDCTPTAARAGVRGGQPLREAVALCPALFVLEERPARTAQAAEALVEALGGLSPLVEAAAPGEAYADLRGLDGLYPERAQLAEAILAAACVAGPAPSAALSPRLGLADTRFAAHAAARCAMPSAALAVEPGTAAAFLAPLPAAWLPLNADALDRLRLFGITTIGGFAALPAHAVQAQFGAPGWRAWRAAHGDDPTPLRPRPPALERVVERAQSEPPLVSREAVTLTMEQLLLRALRHPRAHRRVVRAVNLRATSADDRLWERTQVLREPTGDRMRLWHAIRPQLEHAEYPGPIAALTIELGGLTAERGRQSSLFDAARVRRREQMNDMVRHLKVRYGLSPLARMVEVEPWSRIPERRWALMDYDP